MPEGSTRLITELLEACNAHDLEGVAALHAPDYEGVDVGEATPQHGPQGIRQSLARYLLAFPDLHLTIEEPVAAGDRVVLTWAARGTHRGTLMHIPATGRGVVVRGVSLLTISGGRVTRGLYIWDVAGLLRSLGLLPDL